MKLNIRILLSIMMFLQYFIWGAWYVTLSAYLLQGLEFEGVWIGRAYTAAAIAAIISPFFIGLVADRFFSTEKVLGVLHLLGAGVLFWASTVVEPQLFFVVLILYMVCYMPTLALTNSLSFHQMTSPEKEFPGIRVLGTIGWIIAGFIVGSLFFQEIADEGTKWGLVVGNLDLDGSSIEPTAIPMQIAAAASIIMGIFCFFLPHTPPQSKGKEAKLSDILGLDALKLMKERSFATFIIASFLICIPLQFYYTWTNGFLNELEMKNVALKMAFGQMSEIFFMLLMPLFFARLGVKWMLIVGVAFWTIRYVCFAFGDVDGSLIWLLYGGIIVHGICYDFFFVTGQIYVDKKAPRDLRASAQGFIALVTLGLGMWVGGEISGRVKEMFTGPDKLTDWQGFWLIPAGMAAVVLVLFALLFNDKVEQVDNEDVMEGLAEDSTATEMA